MKIEPKLEQFLKEKGVLDAFIHNSKEHYERYSRTAEWVCVYNLGGAFSWDKTKEGLAFWNALHHEFNGSVPPEFYAKKQERKFEEITIPAIAVETKCFGAESIDVRMKVDLEELFTKFSYSDIREYFEEQIEDEILEARNEGYKRGLEEDRDLRSYEADRLRQLRGEY